MQLSPIGRQGLGYDRESLVTGMVHLGLGAFHRAHQAAYTEQLIAAGDTRWGCLGVSLREPGVARTLSAQDCLYSLTEREEEAWTSKLIGGIRAAVFAPSALETVLSAIASPQVHIVSTTVTEKGYCRLAASDDLDLNHPDIVHDLAHPEAPRSTLGVLAAGLRRRSTAAPLTVVCCDNMGNNGVVLRRLLHQFACQLDAGLASRIDGDIAFPCTMVDRIVPAATEQSLQWVRERIGLSDEAAVVSEAFSQWVIEDNFAGPRPAWEVAGAEIVRDVAPYEAMKLRLLNGTHSAIAYIGQLCGLATVADVMNDPEIGAFVRELLTQDLLATTAPPGGFDIEGYCRDLLKRFKNPVLGHRTEQIAMDGTQKVPVRWLPALRQAVEHHREQPFLERALACWLLYLVRGRDDVGCELKVNDPGAASLAQRMHAIGLAANGRAWVVAALSEERVFGKTPWPDSWVTRVGAYLERAHRDGAFSLVRGALTHAA